MYNRAMNEHDPRFSSASPGSVQASGGDPTGDSGSGDEPVEGRVSASAAAPASGRFPWLAVLAMAVIIVSSNILVGYPINDWLVWGAITYPFAFLVTDLTNRFHGVVQARRVVYAGFAIGVLASFLFADMRIALASGTAFITAQLIDVYLFDRLRSRAWWIAPLGSSVFSTVVDTLLFFSLAMVGTGLPWLQFATGDLAIKWLVVVFALAPYRWFTLWLASARTA